MMTVFLEFIHDFLADGEIGVFVVEAYQMPNQSISRYADSYRLKLSSTNTIVS